MRIQRRQKFLWAFGLAIALFFLAWTRCSRTTSTDSLEGSPTLVLDRLWVDHVPISEVDMVKSIFLDARDGNDRGVLGVSSSWRFEFDLVHHKLSGSILELELPQYQRKDSFQLSIRRCDGEAPKPLDLCLTLRNGSGIQKYYGSANDQLLAKPVDEARFLREWATATLRVVVVYRP